MKADLTDEEREVLDWLSEQTHRGSVPWSEFTEKVEDVTNVDSYEDVPDDRFEFHLVGVTFSMRGGEKMYPVRDLEQGITRGYSTD